MTQTASPLIDLLTQIDSGITIFEPFRRTSAELVEFQETVRRLQELEQLGLVRRVFTQQRNIAGQDYYDLAMVQGGMTDEGQRLLEQQQNVLEAGETLAAPVAQPPMRRSVDGNLEHLGVDASEHEIEEVRREM